MGQLIAKTASAVAVTDALATLLDWTSIELFSGFSVIIENAGGGSGNDITDVQIDTSPDGGVTVSTDQHAGVPAVPIAAGAAATGTFAETAAFVRVRAVCAEGGDTTAKAWLLADSALARICTLADVKGRLGITGTDYDVVLNRIILGIENIFDNYTRRKLIQVAADVTEYYAGCGQYLQLDRYPVIAITSVKQALDFAFDSADALLADENYRLLGTTGIIYRLYQDWYSLPDSIQVICRGGYCPAAQAPGTGETALPAELREAAIEQSCFLFKRKDDLGLSSVSAEGGSISKFSAMKLLPLVTDILDSYKKPGL